MPDKATHRRGSDGNQGRPRIGSTAGDEEAGAGHRQGCQQYQHGIHLRRAPRREAGLHRGRASDRNERPMQDHRGSWRQPGGLDPGTDPVAMDRDQLGILSRRERHPWQQLSATGTPAGQAGPRLPRYGRRRRNSGRQQSGPRSHRGDGRDTVSDQHDRDLFRRSP